MKLKKDTKASKEEIHNVLNNYLYLFLDFRSIIKPLFMGEVRGVIFPPEPVLQNI
jgi:hypothetical protein